MASPLATRLDSLIGDGVAAAVRTEHRVRLHRLGWERALDPPRADLWAQGVPPPREGCSVSVLIDGAQALPEIADAIAGARRFVHITGWHLAPHFELVRGEQPVVLGAVLAEAAERLDVRVLEWAGAPIPLFHPPAPRSRSRSARSPGACRSAVSPTRESTGSTVITRRRW